MHRLRVSRRVLRGRAAEALWIAAVLAFCSLAIPCVADEIAFRILSPDDFRAASAPPKMASHPNGVDAASCLRVTWPPDLPIQIAEHGGPSAKRITATLARPEFNGAFDRSCSWWEPTSADPHYALVHEQVHFAIVEYAARELTRKLRESGTVITGRGFSREEAFAQVRAKLRVLANSARRAADVEHRSFDHETHEDRSAQAQDRWVARYQRLLGTRLVAAQPSE